MAAKPPERDERAATALDSETAIGALLDVDPGAAPASEADLLGAWTLVTMQGVDADGATFHPLGTALAGQLVYDASGRMSAQIVRTDQPRFASSANAQARPEEIAAAWRSYIGYFGTFTLDVEARTVTHHVEGAWSPNVHGSDLIRTCRLNGDRLVLEAGDRVDGETP